jgi:hypothetical protein
MAGKSINAGKTIGVMLRKLGLNFMDGTSAMLGSLCQELLVRQAG